MTRLNKVLIQGRLGAEPEISDVDGGSRLARLRVALDTGYKDVTGEWQKRADWIRVVTFQDKLIEKLERGRKLTGAMVYVDGRLCARTYEKDGENRSSVEIEVGPYGTIMVLAG